jgi:hypothetical protein
MNERIKDIFDQACFETDYDDVQNLRETMDRFAELIVRECIQVVDGMADPEEDSDCYVWTLYNACKKIKEHFGVL